MKELDLTEGRCTGIPTIRTAMADNGSPPPRFSTDVGRTHFLVELPVHLQMPGMQAHVLAHDEAHVLNETEKRILVLLSQAWREELDGLFEVLAPAGIVALVLRPTVVGWSLLATGTDNFVVRVPHCSA